MLRVMERLRTWLTEADKTQAQFAKEMGVSQPTVSDWLNGRISPTAGKLRKISEHTGLSIDDLLAAPAASTPTTHAAA
jgi:transcriptional regulator with XRE-family HTH domain